MKTFWFGHEHRPHMGHRFRGRGGFGSEMWGPGARTRRGDIKFLILAVLEERSGGRYRPSPGSVYPTLTMLEEGGFVTGEQADGKRIFTITDAGRALLANKPAGGADADDDNGVDLRGAAVKLGVAVMQVARASDEPTQERVRAILDAARREVYQILSDSQ
jgi:DNA-binding PadR family transcriptional regulator